MHYNIGQSNFTAISAINGSTSMALTSFIIEAPTEELRLQPLILLYQ